MPATPSYSIAFIGGGNMARALIAGLLRRGWSPQGIHVGEPYAETRAALARDYGVRTSAENGVALAGAELVVLAVKPLDALATLRDLPSPPPVLLSVAAGLTIAQLASHSPEGTPIIRAMPNRPALLGAGIAGLYAPAHIDPIARERAEQVAGAAGRAVWLPAEDDLNIVTALSGSGPAYFLLLAEHLAAAAVSLGLPEDTATLLATETLYGAGLLAHQTLEAQGTSLAHERFAVTSKGGTTEAALAVLRDGSLDELVARALRAASARSAQLAAGASLPGSGR